MRNLIRLVVLAVFTCTGMAQTMVYLELDRGVPEETESFFVPGYKYQTYKVPERREIITQLLAKAQQERVGLQFTRRDRNADYILIMDGEGWAIESAETGKIVDEKDLAILFKNTIKDIIQTFKYLK